MSRTEKILDQLLEDINLALLKTYQRTKDSRKDDGIGGMVNVFI